MKSRLASTLILFGVLTAGCGEILGEDFKGYRMRCSSGSSSCTGSAGVSGSPSAFGGENTGGAAGKPAIAGRGGMNEPTCRGLKCGALEQETGGSAVGAGSAGTDAAGGSAGGSGSGGNAGSGGYGSNSGSAGRAESAAKGELGGWMGSAGSSGSSGVGGWSDGAGSAGSAGVGGSAGCGGLSSAGGIGGSFGSGSSGVGNSAGSSSSDGLGSASGSGGTTCQPAIPECDSNDGTSYPRVMMPAVHGIGMLSAEQFGGGFSVFAAKRAASTVAQLWSKTPQETEWTEWSCLDALPEPDRLAANALLNFAQDVFVTTRCGELYRRALLYEGNIFSWHRWEPFSVPSAGMAVTDVAVTEASDGSEVVYVADAGRVFARPRLGTEQSSPFTDWFEISGVSNASLITAGLRSDSRMQTFAIDANGSVLSAIQNSTDATSSFGDWSDFDSSQLPGPVLDIEVPNGGPLPMEVFAVDANGALWQRAQDKTTGVFGPWKAWDGPSLPGKLTSLTGAGLRFSKTAVRLTVLTRGGSVYSSKRTSGTWDDWRWFP